LLTGDVRYEKYPETTDCLNAEKVKVEKVHK
jgi:hypothetical protein